MKRQENEIIKSFGPCDDGFMWLSEQKSIETAWNNCRRPDWMVWALNKIGYNDGKNLRLFACRCVKETRISENKTAWDLLTDDRSRNAVITAERYANGEATEDELDAAWDAAREQQANILREMIPFAEIEKLFIEANT